MNRENLSSAELVGRLGQQPELKYTEDQTPYVQLSVATSETFTDRGGEIREKTEWHRAIAWGDIAKDIAAHFGKGDSVVLTGAMRINSYEANGSKNRVSEIHVDQARQNVENAPSKNDSRLVGVVREEPKAKTLQNGTAMTLLSVATKTMVNGKEREDWHSVTLWGRTAEAAAREIRQGDTLSVNGSLRHRTIPGEAGQDRKVSAVECSRFQVLERAHERVPEAQHSPGQDLDRPATPAAPEQPKARSRTRGKSSERSM